MRIHTLHPIVKVMAGLLVFGLATHQAAALEIDPEVAPQIDIGGRALVTVNQQTVQDQGGETDADTALEFVDSSLLFGFSKYLFDSTHYGFAALGFKTLADEAEADLRDDVYLHQMHAGVGGERFEVKLGRSNLPTTLIVFPTLRDDDLLDFTHVGNAFSYAPDEAYQLYGSVISATWFGPVQYFSATGGFIARTETDNTGRRTGSSEFNGANLRVAYDIPEAIKFDRGLRYAGFAWDRQNLESEAGEVNALQAAAVINLNDNPEATWNLDLQATHIDGIDVPDLSGANRARAGQTSLVAALRYGHRPWLQTRWQAALTLGWKDYADFADATAWTMAPSFSYRLGSGVTALVQYQYRQNADGLAALTGLESDQRIYAGLAFDFDYTLNKHLGRRDSILFLEHNIFETGPAGGGH